MSRGKGHRLSADFKARVALDAAKGDKTASELAQEYQVHPTQISQWKRQLLVSVRPITSIRFAAESAR